MRRTVVAAVMTGGCGGSLFHHMTGAGIRPATQDTYPHEVDYELLALTTGKACGSEDSDAARKGHSTDSALNTPLQTPRD